MREGNIEEEGLDGFQHHRANHRVKLEREKRKKWNASKGQFELEKRQMNKPHLKSTS